MNFDEALALFLSYRSNAQKSMLTDWYQKKRFINLLYPAKNGLPVYLEQNQYVVLRSADVDLDLFLEEISQKSMSEKEHFSVTQVNSILDSLDTSWDRKVCKVILWEHLSKQEHKETGLGLRVCKHKSQVFEAIETRKAVRNETETNVKKEISEKISRIDQRNLHEEENLEKKSKLLNKQQHDELTEKIEDLKDRKLKFQEINNTDGKNSKGLRQMINRKYGRLILDKRVGMRKASSGRPQQIDEEDEQFILQCIEEKATANGRRHDAVLYTGHRVKKKDFLKLFNRERPTNKRSVQAKKHLGLGLFCGQKTTKAQRK